MSSTNRNVISHQQISSGRAACTECARRKQKCNRNWPCNNCQKRNVVNKCHFMTIAPKVPGQSKKRDVRPESDGDSGEVVDGSDPESEALDGPAFQALGYTTQHLFSRIYPQATEERPSPSPVLVKFDSCPQLRNALNMLPPRPYVDSLVKNFLDKVNFHYYIVHPSTFLDEYQNWWSDRISRRSLSLQWTCLLIVVCACSTQYLDTDIKRKFELDLAETAQSLAERYHQTSHELYSTAPVGQSQLLDVQYLLHSCYWYKSEARFTECWHALANAIRAAQEVGIHQEKSVGNLPDFVREMHRRVWCVLNTWDWQISALLSRPLLIDRTDSNVGQPDLTVENTTPSPLLNMKLQSEIINELFNRFGLPKNITEPFRIQEYQELLEDWMSKFPPTYSLTEPDYSQDALHPWIPLHRHYLRTMGYSMILDPMRVYLAKYISMQTASRDQLRIRSDGINYALKLLDALHAFFDHVWPHDAKFHFVIFAIFDTATLCSTIIIHDQDNTAPRRQEMFNAFEMAIDMINRLKAAVPNAQLYHRILVKLQREMQTKSLTTKHPQTPCKRAKITLPELHIPKVPTKETAPTSETFPSSYNHDDVSNDCSFQKFPQASSQPSHLGVGAVQENRQNGKPHLDSSQSGRFRDHDAPVAQEALQIPVSGDGSLLNPSVAFHDTPVDAEQSITADTDFSMIDEEELGQLANLWKWQSLDLDLFQPSAEP